MNSIKFNKKSPLTFAELQFGEMFNLGPNMSTLFGSLCIKIDNYSCRFYNDSNGLWDNYEIDDGKNVVVCRVDVNFEVTNK